jgi:hypothetical protein
MTEQPSKMTVTRHHASDDLVAKTPSGWPLYPEKNRDRKKEYNQHVHCEVEG